MNIVKQIVAAMIALPIFIASTHAADSDLPKIPSGVNSCTDANSCLMAITQNTYATLQSVNNIPVYLSTLTKLALSWMAPDDTTSTANIQASFAAMGNILVQDANVQTSLQQQMTADLLKMPLSAFTQPVDNPEILKTLPIVNDLSYASLLGLKPVPKGASTPYNYIKNAAGFNLTHAMPSTRTNWSGTKEDQLRYYNYYTTITSIESFDGYLISQQYANNLNGNSFSPTQASLVSQASSSDWIAQISTEDLGKVLRQILMYESQSYVLMTELLRTQRQLLTAIAMSNTLLIASNQTNESILLSKAKKIQPGG